MEENIVPTCNPCNLDFHLSPNGRQTVGRAIRSSLLREELEYVVMKKNVVFLENYYPDD